MYSRHFILMFAVLAVLAVAAPRAQGGLYSDAVLADNPVSYWQFEDASANDLDPAADTMGVNPGTYHVVDTTINLVPNPLPGIGGTAADFSGSAPDVGPPSAYVLVPDHASLDLTTALTLEAWINTDYYDDVDPNFHPRIMGKLYESYSLMVQETGDLVLYVGAPAQEHKTVTVNDGNWHHVVATFDSADVGSEVKMYIDGGAPVYTGSFAGPLTPNDEPLAISSEVWAGAAPGSQGFQGLIDEAALYGTALSQEQIQAHYNAAYAVEGVLRWDGSVADWGDGAGTDSHWDGGDNLGDVPASTSMATISTKFLSTISACPTAAGAGG